MFAARAAGMASIAVTWGYRLDGDDPETWQADATKFIEAGGGKVVGSIKHPLGTTDFSSYLLQAQASKAQAIVVLNAGLDLSNALKQASEYRLTKNGQIVTVFGMTINSVAAMGLDVAQGLQITAPFYWDRDADSRAWAKRFMERNKGVAPTYIMAGAYSATVRNVVGEWRLACRRHGIRYHRVTTDTPYGTVLRQALAPDARSG